MLTLLLTHENILLQNIFFFLGLIGEYFGSHNQSTAGDSPQKSFFACCWQKKELNMDHVAKLLVDKNKLENLIIHFQYLLDNEVYCDLVLDDFMVKWKIIIDRDLMPKTNEP